MRIRTQEDRVDFSETESVSEGTPATVTKTKAEGAFRVTSDVVVPNFHKRVKAGELFFNPYRSYHETRTVEGGAAGYKIDITDGPDYYKSISRGAWFSSSKVGLLHHQPNTFNYQNLEALAITQAHANVAKPEFAALVSLGELRETISYVRNPLKGLTTLIRRNRKNIVKDYRKEIRAQKRHQKRWSKMSARERAVARGKRYFYNKELDALSDSYLGGRYGLRPLIAEVQGLMEAIDAYSVKPPERLTARGFAQGEGTKILLESASPYRQYLNGVTTTDRTAEFRAGVLYSADIRDSFGTNLSQVPIALWELTFLSFMVDWFANIGDYISAISPKPGVRYHGSWLVTRTNTSTVRRWTSSGCTKPEPYSVTIPCNGSDSLISKTVERKINPSIRLAYRPRGVKFDLGTGRILDMIGIARNLIK